MVTHKQLSDHFAAVSFLLCCHSWSPSLNSPQLKKIFHIICTLCLQSRFGWDNTLQQVTALDYVFDPYIVVCLPLFLPYRMLTIVQRHPNAGPWKGKSFPPYKDMLYLYKNVIATGRHIMVAGSSTRMAALVTGKATAPLLAGLTHPFTPENPYPLLTQSPSGSHASTMDVEEDDKPLPGSLKVRTPSLQ
jgi:hypothetical protein